MKFFNYLIDVSLITFIRDRDANNLLLFKSEYKKENNKNYYVSVLFPQDCIMYINHYTLSQ